MTNLSCKRRAGGERLSKRGGWRAASRRAFVSPSALLAWLAFSAAAAATPLGRPSLHNWNNEAIFPNILGAVSPPAVNGVIGGLIDNTCVLDTAADCQLPTGAALFPGDNLSDLANAATARINLGLRWSLPTDPPFNAKCDDSTDDGTAIVAWAAALTAATPGYIPGKCLTSLVVTFPVVSGLSVFGDGIGSMLVYIGSSTTATPFVFGSTIGGCSMNALTLKDFAFASRTTMTAGDGVLLKDICGLAWRNVRVRDETDYSWGKWWTAAEFEGGNANSISGFYQFLASHQNVQVEGDAAYQYTDLFISGGGQIFGATIGINIAGNVGGFTIRDGDLSDNGTQIRISQDAVALPNLQITVGSGVAVDATGTGTGRGIDIEDPGGPASILTLDGAWVASSAAQCVYFASGVMWNLNFLSGDVVNCGTDGIYLGSSNLSGLIGNISFDPTADGFIPSVGYGVDCPVANTNVAIQGAKFIDNPASGNFSPLCAVQSYVDKNASALATAVTPTTAWGYDVSGQAHFTVANGANAAFPAGSGMITVTDTATNDTATYDCGDHACYLLGSATASFVASTTSPAGGKLSVAWNGSSAYALYNSKGSPATIAADMHRTSASN